MNQTLLSSFGTSTQRVENALDALREGRGVMVLDDENRENEGDMIFAAENMTVEQMADTDTTLFVARDETGRAVGMGALKMHGEGLGEIKRMFTRPEVRGQRVGRQLLESIVALAQERKLATLMLETGTGEGMAEAHRLYTRCGFTPRGAFLGYPESPWSAFFELQLGAERAGERQLQERHLHVSANRGEEVVEVVRHPARQPPHRLHLLRLPQLLLQLPAGGEVVGEPHLSDERARLVVDG